MAKLIYLGRLMDAIGKEEERLELPAYVTDSIGLRDWLDAAHGGHGLLTDKTVRIAINDAVAAEPCRISNADEIVFFPPVGGG